MLPLFEGNRMMEVKPKDLCLPLYELPFVWAAESPRDETYAIF